MKPLPTAAELDAMSDRQATLRLAALYRDNPEVVGAIEDATRDASPLAGPVRVLREVVAALSDRPDASHPESAGTATASMSPREAAQHALAAYLNSDDRWSAPYGVIEGLADLPRGGKVRNVTFGVARWLDAHATIWSPTRIVIEGQGALADKVEGTFASVDDAIAHLKAAW